MVVSNRQTMMFADYPEVRRHLKDKLPVLKEPPLRYGSRTNEVRKT